jgi:hypothetical protein
VAALGRIGPDAKAAAPRLKYMLTSRQVDKTYYYEKELAVALWQVSGDADLPIRVLASRGGAWDDPAWDSPEDAQARRNGTFHPRYSRRPQEREEATENLGRIGPPAVPALILSLDDNEGCVQEAAAKALGDIRPVTREIIEALTRRAAEGVWRIRWTAIDVLRQLGPAAKPAVLPLMQIVLKDRCLSLPAAKAVWEIGHDAEQATPCLIEAIERGQDVIERGRDVPLPPDGEAYMEEAARSARLCEATKILARIGPEASEALPVLENELQDAGVEVRIVARDAIRRIERTMPKP